MKRAKVITASTISPKYYPASVPEARILNGAWSDSFKKWVAEFFEVFGPQFNRWASPYMMGSQFIIFDGGVIMRQNQKDVGDCGLVVVTVNTSLLLKETKCASLDELVQTVDPVEFANKAAVSESLQSDDPDYIDLFYAEFYVTRLFCEDTGWNIGADREDPYARNPIHIFETDVEPSPFKKQGIDEPKKRRA